MKCSFSGGKGKEMAKAGGVVVLKSKCSAKAIRSLDGDLRRGAAKCIVASDQRRREAVKHIFKLRAARGSVI